MASILGTWQELRKCLRNKGLGSQTRELARDAPSRRAVAGPDMAWVLLVVDSVRAGFPTSLISVGQAGSGALLEQRCRSPLGSLAC